MNSIMTRLAMVVLAFGIIAGSQAALAAETISIRFENRVDQNASIAIYQKMNTEWDSIMENFVPPKTAANFPVDTTYGVNWDLVVSTAQGSTEPVLHQLGIDSFSANDCKTLAGIGVSFGAPIAGGGQTKITFDNSGATCKINIDIVP